MRKLELLVAGIVFCGSTSVWATEKKPLSERVVTMDTTLPVDEAYNQALDEMQNLGAKEKVSLSKDLEKILLGDKSTERRANAASALGDICGEAKANDSVLTKAAKDKEKVVRQAVASAITRCGATPAAVTTLKGFLKDNDETVRTLAETNLERLGVPVSAPAKKAK